MDPFLKPKNVGELHTSPIVRRYAGNPVFVAGNIPFPATYAFNAGAIKYHGKYYLAFRYNYFPDDGSPQDVGTGLATSDDGIHWVPMAEPVRVHYQGELLPWVNDSRLTVLEDELYLSFCFENRHSERPGIARWRGSGVDFDAVTVGIPQQRNMILCPFKYKGLYMRLERPSNQWGDPFHVWYGLSPDLRYWGDQELLLGCEDVPFANRKIGAGAPPVVTDKGVLLIFHAVDECDPPRQARCRHGNFPKRYTAGAALFDKDDPTKLIAITKSPLLVAEAPYENGDPDFLVQNTVFPCGAFLEDDRKTLRIYYGAADSITCLAEVTLDDLWTVMTPCSRIAERATVPFDVRLWKEYPKYKDLPQGF